MRVLAAFDAAFMILNDLRTFNRSAISLFSFADWKHLFDALTKRKRTTETR